MTSGLPVSRKPLWVLLLAYLVFVVYGSLVPLNFTARPLEDALAAFRAIPFLKLGIESRADWVANFLLFIPLGFLAGRLLNTSTKQTRRLAAGIAVILSCAALATSIEFTQLFFPPRTVSQNDVLAESLGGIIGVLLQIRWGALVENGLLSLWQHESRARRIDRLLYGYLALLLIFNIMPLDLTISPADLYHKWSAGRIVLISFGIASKNWSEPVYGLITDVLVWIPAGMLWAIHGSGTLATVIRRGLVAGLIIEILQIFIYSRITDATDVLCAGLGTALGALWMRRFYATGRLATIPSRLWITLWVLWAASILILFWYPFNFQINPATPFDKQVLSSFHLPFLTYYQGSEYRALNELLRKTGFFIPGGALWMLMMHTVRPAFSLRGLMFSGALVTAGIATLVELGQLYLPSKVADVTDWALECTGALAGMMVSRWILSARDPDPVLPAPVVRPMNATDGPKPAARQSGSPALGEAICIGILSLLILLAVRLPVALPYNLRELIGAGWDGAVSAVGLALAVYWMVAGHLIGMAWIRRDRRWILALPAWMILHALAGTSLVMVAAPVESVHDLVGSPVLHWPGRWEIFMRFLALHTAIALQATGALLVIASLMLRQGPAPSVFWLLTAGLFSPLLHWVIVTEAATDNLTELMRDGGSFGSSARLALGIFFGFLTASALAVLTLLPARSWKMLCGIILMAAPLTYFFLESGTEPLIIKYGRVFSAFQFLLSTDREHYPTGAELANRFAMTFVLVIVAIAALQRPRWKALLYGAKLPQVPSA